MGGDYLFNNSYHSKVMVQDRSSDWRPFVQYFNPTNNQPYLARYQDSSWVPDPNAQGKVFLNSHAYFGEDVPYQVWRNLYDDIGYKKNQIRIQEYAYEQWENYLDTSNMQTNYDNFVMFNWKYPLIAYSDATDQNKLIVKAASDWKHWNTVGIPGTTQPDVSHSILSLAMNDVGESQSIVYVAYQKPLPDGKLGSPVIIKSVNSGPWQEVGNSNLSASPAAIAMYAHGDVLYIAYKGRDDVNSDYTLRVKKLVNNNWQDVGNINIKSNFPDIPPGLYVNSIKDRVFVTYDGMKDSNTIGVLGFENNTWYDIGSFSNAQWPSLDGVYTDKDDDVLYISYTSNYLPGKTPNTVVLEGVNK
jgi:hypothetical protein